jgi:Sec7-like guanine-nucleotide exchange factor
MSNGWGDEVQEHGKSLFNVKPKKGLAYLIETGHLKNTPEDIARFFYTSNHGLDKAKVGAYLGEPCVHYIFFPLFLFFSPFHY